MTSGIPVSIVDFTDHSLQMSNNSALELFKFSDEPFDAEEFIKTSLQTNSNEDINDFKKNIIEFKARAITDLQKTVYKNYKEFSKITVEISSLEGDMSVLRGLLGELTAVQGVVKSLVPIESNFSFI